MSPVLLTLGGRPLYAYWFFYGLGLSVGAILYVTLVRRRGFAFRDGWGLALALVVCAFLGGRGAFYAYAKDFPLPYFFRLEYGGEVSFGAFGGALAAALAGGALRRLPAGDVLDPLAPALFAGEGIQRIGCFLNGCCYGVRWNGPGAVRFPKFLDVTGDIVGTSCFTDQMKLGLVDRTDAWSLPVFPIQPVMTVLGLGLAAAGVVLHRRGLFRGRILWLAFAAYGIVRFATQWFRPNYDFDGRTAGWNSGHTMSLVMAAAGLALLFLLPKPSPGAPR